MRLAFLADIHGNLPALEAVVADLKMQSPDAVYLVGDQISRVPWHNEVMDLLAEHDWPAIYGNHDWVIGRLGTPENSPPFTDRERFATLWWTMETLRPEHRVTVRALPGEMLIKAGDATPIRMVHGIPNNPFVGIFPYSLSDVVSERLRNVQERVVVAGHTHRPMDRTVEGWRIFNGGSIGLPYNGDPRAQYLILEWDGETWQPDFRRVPFDRSTLREAFNKSGMLEAAGATAELHVLTALNAEPWSSDFAFWLGQQPRHSRMTMESAVAMYLAQHGPGRWAFSGEAP